MRIAIPDAVDYVPYIMMGTFGPLTTQRSMIMRDGLHPCVPLHNCDDSVPSNGLQRQEFHLFEEGNIIQ